MAFLATWRFPLFLITHHSLLITFYFAAVGCHFLSQIDLLRKCYPSKSQICCRPVPQMPIVAAIGGSKFSLI
jgi:hypothetical protein